MVKESTNKPCRCDVPSIVKTVPEEPWHCGKCGGQLSAEYLPDPDVLNEELETKNRAADLNTVQEFAAEFGKPHSVFDRETIERDLADLKEYREVEFQMLWKVTPHVDLIIQKFLDGHIEFGVSMRDKDPTSGN